MTTDKLAKASGSLPYIVAFSPWRQAAELLAGAAPRLLDLR